jgi:hypothetical protein
MPGPTGSRKRKGARGPCSYCGKRHKKGKRRGDSCRGHKPIAESTRRVKQDLGKNDQKNNDI